MCIFTLIFFSHVINISYLALWIMETLKHQQNYIQYNETLLISSVFFMVGSGLFGIASQINLSTLLIKLDYPFEIDHRNLTKGDSEIFLLKPSHLGYYINKIFLFILGLILLFGFTMVKNNIYMFILSTIGLGFHLALLNYVYFKVQKIIQ